MADRKSVPRRARASRLGVRFMGFAPRQPRLSARNWSEMMSRMLGRFGCAWACMPAALAVAAAVASQSLRLRLGIRLPEGSTREISPELEAKTVGIAIANLVSA